MAVSLYYFGIEKEEPHLFTDELIEEYRSMIKEGVEQEIAWGHYVIGDDIFGIELPNDYRLHSLFGQFTLHEFRF